jgi:phage I-like protein
MLALRASSLPAGDLPSRLVILPWGQHDLGKRGTALCSETTAATFAAAMAALKFNGPVALDFNHNSLPGHPAYLAEKEPRRKAAWGMPRVIPGEGIVLEALTWTPEGRDAFLGGHFQDISPVIFRDKENHVIAIHSAALCDHGEVDGLTIEAATAPPELQSAFAALSASITPALHHSTTPALSPTPPMKPELIAALAALLKGLEVELSPEADETTIASALTAAAGKIDDLKKAAAPKVEETPMKKEEVKPDALSTQITDLQTRLATVEAEKDQARRDALMAEAIRDGKLIPLSTDLWNAAPVAVCEGLVKAAQPGAVPLQKKTPDAETTTTKAEALSAETEGVLNSMGLTKEDFEKYGPK